MTRLLVSAALAAVFALSTTTPAEAVVRGKPVHAIALYGEPKYGPNQAFDFVNPNAPKGGTLRLVAAAPTFDTLNPFVIKGTPAAGVVGTLFYQTLAVRGENEPFSAYCLICETMTVAEDNSWIEFTLRPQAKFNDGSAITPEDVIFSFDALMTKGAPNYKQYWGDVAKVEKTGDRKIRFVFKTKENNELALIITEMPVLSKKFWQNRDFTATLLDIPVSSGPYRIQSLEPGRFIVMKRDQNYWAKNLPISRGLHNFDEVRYDYFRDDEVAFQAFKAGQIDLFNENSALRWATGYDQKVIDAKQMTKEKLEDGTPGDSQGFAMNLRRTKFQDARVREAFELAWDFDWSNKTLAFGQYAPMSSYFGASELSAQGLPQGEELQLLERFRGKIPDEVFTKPYSPPRSDGTGGNRENLLKARGLLQAAGWEVKEGTLTNTKTGEKFEFEFLLVQAGLEKWLSPYLRNLERLGIKGKLRIIDAPQYVNRVTAFDFDMIVGVPRQSLSPGNEQREFWGSAAADRNGSRNWAGIKNPALDAIIEELITARTRESLVAHTRALDRILLWSHYHVPELSVRGTRVAYWNNIARPSVVPVQGPDTLSWSSWWADPAKTKALEEQRSRSGK